MMFSLSFVGRSKSAEGGSYPLADLDRGSKSCGVQIHWDTSTEYTTDGIEESNLLDVDDRNGSILAIRLHPIESNA